MAKNVQIGASVRTLHRDPTDTKNLVEGKDYLLIELTQGFKAMVSPIDYDLTLFSWHAHVDNKSGECYACYTERIMGKKKRYWLHNEVMEKMIGRPLEKGEIVDHINRNKLDCRRENLRLSDFSKNQANIKKARSGKRFKGVYYKKRLKKWMALIYHQGKQHYLGVYDNEEDAARAYNKKALELFGEFAYLNDVDSKDIYHTEID